MEFLNALWVEKHRPRKLDELVLPEDHRFVFGKCIEKREIGNFLFHGPPGGGKTALARILCSKEGILSSEDDNLLEINGSARETRGIAYVQKVIEPYLKVPPGGSDKNKVVFIDEADYLTDESFSSLRRVIEKYSEEYGRFIFTCNYISKIPEPIQSRFQIFPFKQLPLGFVIDYCSKVLTSENVEFTKEDLKFVVDSLYPDVRLIVNTLQKNSYTDKLKINRDAVLTSEKKVLAFVVEIVSLVEKNESHKIGGVINSIINLLYEQDLEFRSLYTDLFFVSKLPVHAKIIVNKYSNGHSSCLVPPMHFMGMMFEIIKVLQDYKRSSAGRG